MTTTQLGTSETIDGDFNPRLSLLSHNSSQVERDKARSPCFDYSLTKAAVSLLINATGVEVYGAWASEWSVNGIGSKRGRHYTPYLVQGEPLTQHARWSLPWH